MKFAVVTLAVSLTFLSACSSVQPLHYYQLPQLASSTVLEKTAAPVLVVEPVMVANYLNSNALILQMSEVQLVKTSQHHWAEALDQQLTRLLLQQLAQELPQVRVTDRAPATPHRRLLVQVEQFHGTEQGLVLISGKYSFMDGATTQSQRFSLQLPQTEQGYPALVATLGQGWQQIVQDISGQLKVNVQQVKE